MLIQRIEAQISLIEIARQPKSRKQDHYKAQAPVRIALPAPPAQEGQCNYQEGRESGRKKVPEGKDHSATLKAHPALWERSLRCCSPS